MITVKSAEKKKERHQDARERRGRLEKHSFWTFLSKPQQR